MFGLLRYGSGLRLELILRYRPLLSTFLPGGQMLTRRDKDLLRAVLTLTNAKVNPGVRTVGRLLTPPLQHSQAAKELNRLVERGILVKEERTLGQGSSFRLSREALAMIQASGVVASRPTPAFAANLVVVDEDHERSKLSEQN